MRNEPEPATASPTPPTAADPPEPEAAPPEAKAIPPVPSVWKLAWLLLIQPITLQKLYEAWGLDLNASLIKLWRYGHDQRSSRTLAWRYTLLSLGIVPATTLLMQSIITLSGGRTQASVLIYDVLILLLLTLGSLFFYAAYFSAISISGGIAASSLIGLVDITAPILVSASALIGLTNGFATTLISKRGAFEIPSRRSVRDNAMISFVAGSSFLLYSIFVHDIKIGTVSGLAVTWTSAAVLTHFPLWPLEVSVTLLLAWRMRRRPEAAARLAAWLPLRHDDLIYLPLPGLRACLVQVAEADPALGQELIALAAASPGQRRVARRALIELQARELERVARDRSFARAAELTAPFLPQAPELEGDSTNTPLRPFRAAARDLVAGGTNHRQRQLALERARRSLESLHATTVVTEAPAPLARRLLPTTTLWLDVIRDQETQLAREIAERPQVPSAFVAGPPLTPERAEDRALFRSRADIIRLIAHDLAPDRRGVLLVVGQRRMGKTSLCNWLPEYLGTGTTVIGSNFQPLSGDPHRAAPHRRVLGDISRALGGAVPAPPASDRWGDGLGWLEALDRTLTDRKLLVVIDEIERVEDGIRAGWCSPDFLDFLRAAGDALRNIRFLLLTAYPLHRLGPHWTDRLVSVTGRTLTYLDEPDARELLTRPIPEFPDIYPAGGVDLILARTGRHPYLLQKVGDDLCRLLNARERRAATPDDLTEVFDGILSDAQLFDELWRSRTDDERATLRRLARSGDPGAPDPAALQLVREGYLERHGDQVDFAVPLFRDWIREWKLDRADQGAEPSP